AGVTPLWPIVDETLFRPQQHKIETGPCYFRARSQSIGGSRHEKAADIAGFRPGAGRRRDVSPERHHQRLARPGPRLQHHAVLTPVQDADAPHTLFPALQLQKSRPSSRMKRASTMLCTSEAPSTSRAWRA